MNRCVIMVVCTAAMSFAAAVFAQDDEEKPAYHALQLHQFGLLEGNLDGIIHRLSGDVKLTLIAESPEDNLDIEAETITFTYTEDGGAMPSHVLFEKNVVFTHAEGVIRSQKATLDFETQEVLFTGNPTGDMSIIRGAEAESIRMNLETRYIVVTHGKVREVLLRDPDVEASSGQQN